MGSPDGPPVPAPADHAIGTVDETDQIFKVETRGIDYIPPADRFGRPRDLFWLWTGSIFNIEYIVYGALLIAIGLSFAQAVIVAVLANLTFLLLGLASLQGPATGTSVFVITRAAFGQRGGRALSLFNWVTQVGFEIEGLAIAVLAGLALFVKAGGHDNDAAKIVVVIIAALLQLLMPLFGHATILKALKWLTYPFLVLFVILAILTAGKVHLSASHGTGFANMAIAFALVFSVAGLGWNYNGSDYSRYLPKASSQKSIVLWVFLGGFVASVLTMILGAAVATATANASNPISGLPSVFPGWFLVPYLIVIIIQLFAINSVVLYSSGLTLQAVGLKVKRFQAVMIDTVVCGVLTAVTIFSSRFNTILSDFLLFLIIWAAPWSAIYLVDWLLRRGRYNTRDLLRSTGGMYWRNGGWHIPAVVAQLLGMVAASMAIDTSVWVGPLSKAANGADFSAWMGLVVGGGVYFLLARNEVRRESLATADDEYTADDGAGLSVTQVTAAATDSGSAVS